MRILPVVGIAGGGLPACLAKAFCRGTECLAARVELFGLCIEGRYAEARALYRILTPAFHLDTHVKLVQYIKLAEHIVHGAPEWSREPRLPLVGEERDRVARTIENTIGALATRRQG